MYDQEKKYVKPLIIESNKYSFSIGNYKILNISDDVKYIRFSSNSNTFNQFEIYPLFTKEENINANTKLSSLEIANNINLSDMIIKNTYINTNGNLCNYNGWSSTDYIDISNYKDFIITNHNDEYNAFYDKNKSAITNINFSNSYLTNNIIGNIGATLICFSNISKANYIRLSNNSNIINKVKLYPVLKKDFEGYLQFKIINYN